MSGIDVSVIVATFQRRALVARTLPTVIDQDHPTDRYEVIVVDDGSADGTARLLRERFGADPRLRVIVHERNRGLAAARNTGVAAARGRIVLFVDDDMRCDRRLVSTHAAAHGGELAVVLGKVYLDEGSPNTLRTDLLRRSRAMTLARHAIDPHPSWPGDAMVCANGSIPKGLIDEVGGFDERFMRVEDVDLGLTLWERGTPFRYEPGAVVHEIFTSSDEDLVRSDGTWHGRNEVLLCRRHPRYRAWSPLGRLGADAAPERWFCRTAARLPIGAERALQPVSAVCGVLRWLPPARSLGMIVVRVRRLLVFFRAAALEAGSPQALEREFGVRLPVLAYHQVGERRPGTYPGLAVPTAAFTSHLGWLRAAGYTPIDARSWEAWRTRGAALPRRPVLITFDDGYADICDTALPEINRAGWPAVVFVVTQRIGELSAWDRALGFVAQRLMTVEQIRAWSAKGIEFGSHGRTHADVTALSPADQEAEVAGSAVELERVTDRRTVAFAYPFGRSNPSARAAAASAFDLAFVGKRVGKRGGKRGGIGVGLNGLRTDAYELRRITVWPAVGRLTFLVRMRLGWSLGDVVDVITNRLRLLVARRARWR